MKLIISHISKPGSIWREMWIYNWQTGDTWHQEFRIVSIGLTIDLPTCRSSALVHRMKLSYINPQFSKSSIELNNVLN